MKKTYIIIACVAAAVIVLILVARKKAQASTAKQAAEPINQPVATNINTANIVAQGPPPAKTSTGNSLVDAVMGVTRSTTRV